MEQIHSLDSPRIFWALLVSVTGITSSHRRNVIVVRVYAHPTDCSNGLSYRLSVCQHVGLNRTGDELSCIGVACNKGALFIHT